jgi:hypothetical protein
MPFTITSVTFKPGKDTCDGENVSLPLNWRDPPQHTGLGESGGYEDEGTPSHHCRGRVGGVYVWQG